VAYFYTGSLLTLGKLEYQEVNGLSPSMHIQTQSNILEHCTRNFVFFFAGDGDSRAIEVESHSPSVE